MTVGAVANRSKVYNEEAEVEAEFDGSLSADGAERLQNSYSSVMHSTSLY